MSNIVLDATALGLILGVAFAVGKTATIYAINVVAKLFE